MSIGGQTGDAQRDAGGPGHARAGVAQGGDEVDRGLSSGPDFGMTLKIARSPAGSIPIGDTVATSGTAPRVCAIDPRSWACMAPLAALGSAVTSSGAL